MFKNDIRNYPVESHEPRDFTKEQEKVGYINADGLLCFGYPWEDRD